LPCNKKERFFPLKALFSSLAHHYSKNLAQNYSNWVNFIDKLKKVEASHKYVTGPAAPSQFPEEVKDLYDVHKEEFTAPDGQTYVIYYSEETIRDHEKQEQEKAEKQWQEENRIEEKWRKEHDDGKIEFNLSGRKNELSSLPPMPIFLGRDQDGNRWYLHRGEHYLERQEPGHWAVRADGLYVEVIRKRHKNGYDKDLNQFLQEPNIYGEKPSEAILNELKTYGAHNFITYNIEVSSSESAMDPKVGRIRIYRTPNEPERRESLEERAKRSSNAIIVDWENPDREKIQKILKSYGVEGQVDAVKFDVGARYSLFEL
jgi:hypothetical protein